MNRVVYFSRGGNTKKLAEAIAKGAGAEALSAEQAGDVAGTDTLFVGASIYAGSIDAKLRHFLEGLDAQQVKRVVVFGTSAGKNTALAEIKAILQPGGIPVADAEFHCKGAFLVAHRGHPDADDLARAEAFAKQMSGDAV
ncbi:flavodoxin [Ruminococcaceae bacterium OttesenSCG-928-O06]|nr:flavodoxin [Ruminococcaceae bacterium OttesenSCG-928-O06]